MVSLSLKDCVTTTANESSEGSHLIKLDQNQATNVPFPPGCPVLVLDNKGNIMTSGLVTAVYVSFIRNTGSCNNCYSVASKDTDGNVRSQVVSGALLRYAINCTIKVSPCGDAQSVDDDDEAIDGVIKGFEVQSNDSVGGNSRSAGADASAGAGGGGGASSNASGCAPLFLYSVEVYAAGANPDEPVTVFRQRGISPEHIRFREPNESESDAYAYSYHPCNEKTSVVSLDDTTDDANDKRTVTKMNKGSACTVQRNGQGHTPIKGLHLSPLKSPMRRSSDANVDMNHELTSPSSHTSHPHLVCETDNRGQGPKQSPSSASGEKKYSKCTPLPLPHPTHFCGNFEKARNERIPDFSYLSNFPHNNMLSLPFGRKRCVMCGEVRSCNVGKSSKTKSMKASQAQLSAKDSVVIPNQNKGLCTLCDVDIWVVNDSGLQIKWCKGCKNFQSWALFGEKGSATKCGRCRERQREKYAASKSKQSTNPGSTPTAADGTGFSSAVVAGNKRKLTTAVDNERVVKRA